MEEKIIKTGLFGGSFNPIHIGHLALANYLCEFYGLDELWFLVSPHNPLKEHTDLLDDMQRLELARLATEGYPRFKVSDFEFRLPRPSYMVHTLEKLNAESSTKLSSSQSAEISARMFFPAPTMALFLSLNCLILSMFPSDNLPKSQFRPNTLYTTAAQNARA